MKKAYLFSALTLLCMGLCGCTVKAGAFSWILIILSLLVLAFGGLRAYNLVQYDKRQRRRKRKPMPRQQYKITGIILLIGLVLLIVAFLTMCSPGEKVEIPPASEPVDTTPVEDPVVYVPHKTTSSDPAKWAASLQVFENDQLTSFYQRADKISFGDPEDYFALPGISTFRGNNYRDSATYGTATVTQRKLSERWSYKTSTLKGSSWSGSGWTGQPLIVKWDDATRAIMNLYPDKKAKTDLVEVIYATLDGHIYFIDLQDGKATRDPINVGMCFKGAGSLDPRGYPLMYVGSGDVNAQGERPRMYIISLIDGKILYQMGHNETVAKRTDNKNWCAFDSAPLVHGDTDTLIWPGENGVLYTMKLGTQYNAQTGLLAISPGNIVKTTYSTNRNGSDKYWYGMEASCSIVENYLYEDAKMEILRQMAIELPLNEQDFNSKDTEEKAEICFEAAMASFKQRTERMAAQAYPFFEFLNKERPEMMDKSIIVPITDGRHKYHIPVNAKLAYESKGKEIIKSFEKAILLHTIDNAWKENLRDLDELKHSVQNASYEQKDPLLIFKLESVTLFDKMINKINDQTVSILTRGQLDVQTQQEGNVNVAPDPKANRSKQQYNESKVDLNDPNQQAAAQHDTRENVKREPIRANKTVGRNDPCPCGSGKKFKNCCGRNI